MKKITEEERRVFREFCDQNQLLVENFNEVDRPDFVGKDASLAIELVQYHKDSNLGLVRGSPSRRAEEVAKELAKEAERKFLEIATQRMNVFIFMGPRWNGDHVNVNSLAHQIARVVLEHQGLEVSVELESLPESFRGYINCLDISPTPDFQEQSLWQIATAAILDVIPDSVQHILRDKEAKLIEYRKHAEEVWLLIYASHVPCLGDRKLANSSTCGRINAELGLTLFESSFDRVYYYDRQQEKIKLLKSERAVELG